MKTLNFPLLFASQRMARALLYSPSERDSLMLRWALIFAVIALIAGFFGFGGIAGAAAGIAKFLFFAFLVVAAIVLILALAAGKKLTGG